MKKGFTLVELLAVIIILGTLSLLIVPKVINTLNDSEAKTNMASAEGLLKAAEYKYQSNAMKGIDEDITINYTTKQNIEKLDFDGKNPEKGEIKIHKNGKISMAVKIRDNCYIKRIHEHDISVIPYNSETCVAKSLYLISDTDGNGVPSLGDEYAIGDEAFYLIRFKIVEECLQGMDCGDYIETSKAVFLAKYNLSVGYETECYEENNITTCNALSAIPTIDPKYGIQDANAKGINFDTNPTTYKGLVPFSQTTYWLKDGELHNYGQGGYPADVYDEQSSNIPRQYINEYVNYLKNLGGPSSLTGRLLNIEDLAELGCEDLEESCSENTQTWVYSTSYWTGIAESSQTIYEFDAEDDLYSIAYNQNDSYGVRPVIEIDLSEL